MAKNEEKKTAPKQTVKVLSKREGDVIVKGGIVIKKDRLVEVPIDVGNWLQKTYPDLMLILEA